MKSLKNAKHSHRIHICMCCFECIHVMKRTVRTWRWCERINSQWFKRNEKETEGQRESSVRSQRSHLNEVRWTHVDPRFYSMPTHSPAFAHNRAEWKMDVDTMNERYALMIVEQNKKNSYAYVMRSHSREWNERALYLAFPVACVRSSMPMRVCACVGHLHAISKPSAVRCTHVRTTYASMRTVHTVLVGSSRETVSATQLIRKLRLIALQISESLFVSLSLSAHSSRVSVAVVEKRFDFRFFHFFDLSTLNLSWASFCCVQLECIWHQFFTETFELSVPHRWRCHIETISFTTLASFSFNRLHSHSHILCTTNCVHPVHTASIGNKETWNNRRRKLVQVVPVNVISSLTHSFACINNTNSTYL